MEANYRFYARRAAEESGREARAITPEARMRHVELAAIFAKRARQYEELDAPAQNSRPKIIAT